LQIQIINIQICTKGDSVKGIVVVVVAVGIILAAVIYRASENAELNKPVQAVSTAAGAYQEQVWDYKRSREELKLEVDKEVLPYKVLAAQLWAVLPPVFVGLAWVSGIAWLVVEIVKRWKARDIVRPDQHGQMPIIIEHAVLPSLNGGAPEEIKQIINLDKLPGAITAIRKGATGPAELPDRELQRIAEGGYWASRVTSSQPGIPAEQEQWVAATLKRFISPGNGQNGGQSPKYMRISPGAATPLLEDAGEEIEGEVHASE
jgi:hypothetical protein